MGLIKKAKNKFGQKDEYVRIVNYQEERNRIVVERSENKAERTAYDKDRENEWKHPKHDTVTVKDLKGELTKAKSNPELGVRDNLFSALYTLLRTTEKYSNEEYSDDI